MAAYIVMFCYGVENFDRFRFQAFPGEISFNISGTELHDKALREIYGVTVTSHHEFRVKLEALVQSLNILCVLIEWEGAVRQYPPY